MPYYVYKIDPKKNLDLMTEFQGFKEAKTFAREHRAGQSADEHYTVKIIFAEDTSDAERKLMQKREAPILMEHEK